MKSFYREVYGRKPKGGNMKAGRELDAKIAEEVMGWKKSPKGWVWWTDANAGQTDKISTDYTTGDLVHNPNQWQPSTNIVHAWEVVEKVKTWKFSERMVFTKELEYEVSKVSHQGFSIASSWWIFYLTPEIICLAARKARG